MPLLSQTCQRLLLVGLTSCFFGTLTAPGLAQWNGGTYQPPREVGSPERTRPAGTRSTFGCPISETSPPMVGIVPLNAFGVTLKSHPNFSFYLPAMPEGLPPPLIEFVIRDLEGNEIYLTRFNSDGRSGIASISPPENSGFQGLELNKSYIWSVAIICQRNDRSRDIVTDGLIQRVAIPPELSSRVLQGMSAIEQAELLSRVGIWYDAVALLSELQRNQPLPQWRNILQAVDLPDLVNQPILDDQGSSTPNSVSPNNPRSPI